MKQQWLTLGAVVFVLACSSSSGPGPGTGATDGGASGGAAGAGGAAGSEPTGGLGAICDAITEEADCNFYPDPENHPFAGCVWRELELFPDTDTCEPGIPIQRCIGQQPGGTGACPLEDCPAEPAGYAYYFRVLADGSVELWHFENDSCGSISTPEGFTHCQMKATDPEACLCRCEL